MNVAKRPTSWTHSREPGDPRCAEDLGENEFVNVLRNTAEEGRLGVCVNVALASTEEADASDAVGSFVVEEDRGDDINAVDVAKA